MSRPTRPRAIRDAITRALSCAFLLSTFGAASAAPHPVDLFYFYGVGCPYCELQRQFLVELQDEVPSLRIHAFEVYSNTRNQALLRELATTHGREVRGVPATFLAEQVFVGFDARTGDAIRELVLRSAEHGNLDPTQYPRPIDPAVLANATASASITAATTRSAAGANITRVITSVAVALALAGAALVIARTRLKRS